MAEGALKAISTKKDDSPVLVIAGNYHARSGTPHSNMNDFLENSNGNNYPRLTIKYSAGEFYNSGVREIGEGLFAYSDKYPPENKEVIDSKLYFVKSDNEFEIHIPKANPITPLSEITDEEYLDNE